MGGAKWEDRDDHRLDAVSYNNWRRYRELEAMAAAEKRDLAAAGPLLLMSLLRQLIEAEDKKAAELRAAFDTCYQEREARNVECR